PSVRDAAAAHPRTRTAFDRCIDALVHFRKTHQSITMRYITQQAPSSDEAIGTGGTEYADFLRRTRLETSQRRLD
ncbi:MAG: indoleamine 2,3-dioxygenase, partial [Phycisphaerales bacterium]|nr:indoleamine 2,3-dioxygenase [Phycisphaerales bacterium]